MCAALHQIIINNINKYQIMESRNVGIRHIKIQSVESAVPTAVRRLKTFIFSPVCCAKESRMRCVNDHHRLTTISQELTEETMQAAEIVWNYMILGHKLTECDVILVLGNNDLRTAEYAADLYLKGLSNWLLFSGKDGSLTKGKWEKSEAEIFFDVAVSRGVPTDKIILETDATNTGENIRYSYKKLYSLGIQPSSIILVQTPYMERRTYATFKKQWEDPDAITTVMVTSPRIGLKEFPNDDVGSLDDVITVMIGCLERIMSYPTQGFQISQEVPAHVHKAYEKLLGSGRYNQHLLNKCS